MSASDDGPLDDDLTAEVADRRAHGLDWDAVARELALSVFALRRAVWRTPGYDRAYERAIREVRHETEAAALAKFRQGMTDDDPDRALRAAEAADKCIAAERRDRTRLEVEALRADAIRAKAAAKATRADEGEEEHEDEVPPPQEWGPEVVHRPNIEGYIARRAADDKALVWLWGGARPVGGREPDPASDIPLVLFGDDTVRGKKLYWATTYPLPGLPTRPEPCPAARDGLPPDLTPEQAAQLEVLAAGAPVA